MIAGMRMIQATLWAVSALAAPSLFGEVRSDRYYGDHMVVQRDAPLVVRGTAGSGEAITPTFAGATAATTADGKGRWEVVLAPQSANFKGATLSAKGSSDEVSLRDVLVGDVWINAGQSNMEFALWKEEHAKTELPLAADAGLRLLTHDFPGQSAVRKTLPATAIARLAPEKFYDGTWAVASPQTARNASAIAYYFANKLRTKTGIPIGIVGYAIGGAPIETFISRAALTGDPRFAAKTRGDWLNNSAIDGWVKMRAAEQVAELEGAPRDSLGINHGCKPGFAFEAGPGRIAGIPVKGVLWYQGESNAIEKERVEEYPRADFFGRASI